MIVKSVIFLRSEEGLTSSDKDNSANFPGLKCSTMKHSLVSILITIAEKTVSEVSYLWSFWSSNLKVSNSTMNGAVEIYCVRYTLS